MKEFIRTVIVGILTVEARAVLKKYKPKIVVVTGSVGKTSTKDALYVSLKNHTFVRKSEKSFNSDIGVPLTILGVPNGWNNIVQWVKNIFDGFLLLIIHTPYPQWLIVEVGADRPGDISRALAWIRPTVVVTTRFPDIPVHVEFYSSPQAVVEEELFPLSLLGAGGVAVLNDDDDQTKKYTLPTVVKTITYGFSKEADVRASRYRITSTQGIPSGISFDVAYNNEKVHLVVRGVVGRNHVSAILAGVAGALSVGAPFESVQTIAEGYDAPPGRLTLIEGSAGTTIIDDSYNASPVATQEALDTLSEVPTKGRRIAVLGDMLELGTYSHDEHARLGAYASQKVDALVTVGVRARTMAEQAITNGMPVSSVHMFEKGSDAASYLLATIKKGDVILIKGSQSVRLERVTKALMRYPETAQNLLPRQDTEWLARQ